MNPNTGLITAPIAFPNNWTTENKPLKVFLMFLAVPSPILKFSVKSRNFSEMSTNRSPVMAGNASLNASPIGFRILPSVFSTLVIPSITAARPPFAFQN